MGFRSVYPDSVLTPHLALLNPIAMLIDRWMALMFALGWIPALGSNLGRFMWEVSPMSLGGQNLGTMLGRYGFRLPESAADWMIFECIFIKLCWRFFAFPALEKVEVGTTDVWFICTVGWSKMLTLEMVSPLLRGWKTTGGRLHYFRTWVANMTNGTPAKWLKARLLDSHLLISSL